MKRVLRTVLFLVVALCAVTAAESHGAIRQNEGDLSHVADVATRVRHAFGEFRQLSRAH